jgi:hypothetical protein
MKSRLADVSLPLPVTRRGIPAMTRMIITPMQIIVVIFITICLLLPPIRLFCTHLCMKNNSQPLFLNSHHRIIYKNALSPQDILPDFTPASPLIGKI